tara:strand:- start:346 stop:495 length:150 start_codon:yes stop_codon:yes gene_type:complete
MDPQKVSLDSNGVMPISVGWLKQFFGIIKKTNILKLFYNLLLLFSEKYL